MTIGVLPLVRHPRNLRFWSKGVAPGWPGRGGGFVRDRNEAGRAASVRPT